MTVKWIGEVAHELGIAPLDAVQLLARQQSYPMSGLLDEDRVLLLRRFLAEKGGVEASGSSLYRSAVEAARKQPGERSEVTAPLHAQTAPAPPAPHPPAARPVPVSPAGLPPPVSSDRADERTVIIPPPES